MNELMNRFRVRSRLFMLVALVFVGIVTITVISLINLRSAMLEERRAKIVGLVDSAHSVVSHFYQLQQEGKLSEADAKKQATDALRYAKYEKSNYIFIYDIDFTRIMLPPVPETEGRTFKDLKDSRGRFILQEMITIAVTKNSGFIDYWFQRPGSTEDFPKLGYVRYFPEWKWMVGTGVYVDDIDNAFWATARIGILICTALLLCVGGFVLLISRSILFQLGGEPTYALKVVGQVAHGNLTAKAQLRSNDEDSLLAQIQLMIDQLRHVIEQVRDSSESIDVAAREITQGNMDLSTRTESQSASLQVTASSIEELTETVKQNSENAYLASELANTASEVAVHGGVVVNNVVDTMNSIRDSSSKIVDIISVIDGIAFQTNILALNAAVEAARAGEQGRGFAVVASEVRTLAHRSATAAKEIKQLIQDSVQKVQAGTELVDDAGKTMHEIVTSVKRVTEIVGHIAIASKSQAEGIEQVNASIIEMDSATQQNAALVEEAAAAAQSMQDQSQLLVQTVSAFRL